MEVGREEKEERGKEGKGEGEGGEGREGGKVASWPFEGMDAPEYIFCFLMQRV